MVRQSTRDPFFFFFEMFLRTGRISLTKEKGQAGRSRCDLHVMEYNDEG